MDTAAYVRARRELIEAHIKEFLGSHMSDDAAGEAIRYVMEGGKRLRGTTAVLVCEALGGRAEDAMTAAEAVELAHAVSLAKDDWLDRDVSRRGRQAFWVQFGRTMARLLGIAEVGGALLRELGASATLLLADAIVPHAIEMSRKYGPGAVQTVVSAWGRVASGQLKDMGLAKVRSRDPLRVYEEIVGEKTASLFAAASDLGARAAGRPLHAQLARHYGECVGMALQAADDAVDLFRAVGRDWKEIGAGSIVPVSIRALGEVVGDGDEVREEDVKRVVEMARRYASEAENAASLFPESPTKRYLAEFPSYVVDSMLEEGGVPIR